MTGNLCWERSDGHTLPRHDCQTKGELLLAAPAWDSGSKEIGAKIRMEVNVLCGRIPEREGKVRRRVYITRKFCRSAKGLDTDRKNVGGAKAWAGSGGCNFWSLEINKVELSGLAWMSFGKKMSLCRPLIYASLRCKGRGFLEEMNGKSFSIIPEPRAAS